MHMFRRLLSDSSGATMVEYGLIVALVSVSLLVGYGAFTGSLQNTLLQIDNSVSAAGN